MTLYKSKKAFTALLLTACMLGSPILQSGTVYADSPDAIQGYVTEVRPAQTHEEK